MTDILTQYCFHSEGFSLLQLALMFVTCMFLQQNKPEGHSECAHEALNTRLFLALEASIDGKCRQQIRYC